MGLGQTKRFQRYHRVLNHAVWSGKETSRVLLGLLVRTFLSSCPLIIGVDETLERRWARRSPPKGSTATPYAPPTSASSKRAACGGCARCSWCPCPGQDAY